MAESKPIDAKYLTGLKYASSEVKEVKKDGVAKKRHFPTERPLKVEDVLSWADKGDTVVIVTADGRKHVVEKNPKKDDGKGKDDGKK